MLSKEQIIDFWNDTALEREKWKRRNRFYYQEQERYFSFIIPPQSNVLEVGCGTGELLNAVRPSYGIGIDISPNMIEIAKKKYPINNKYRIFHLSFE